MKDKAKGKISMAHSANSRRARLVPSASKEFFWGCRLTKEQPTVIWSFEEEDDDRDYLQHTLFLKHAILGPNVKEGERHIVQIEIRSFDDDILQPLLSIVAGKDDMCQLNITLGHEEPATLKLIEGSGPLYLSGQHVVEFPEEIPEDDPLTVTDTETEVDLEADVKEATEAEIEAAKVIKRKANGLTKGGKKKRGKFESVPSEDDDDDDDDEEEEDGENEDSTDLAKNGDNSEDEEESMDATDEDEEDEDSDDDYIQKRKSKKKGKDAKKKPSKPVKETKRTPKNKKVIKRKTAK